VRRLLEAINAIVEAAVGRRLDYHALYPCSVATQAADGTLDLIPDDARIKGTGLSGIKPRYGLPGFTAVVPAGTRVLLGFEAADPKRPYAALWDAGAVTTLTFDGGTEDVARTNDTTDAGWLYLDVAVPALYYWAADSAPPVWQLVSSGVGPPGVPPPVLGTQIANGLITSGNTKLLA